MSSTDHGFDYMQIDLPFGSGTPSNLVVFFRSAGGNIVYLEDYIDFTTTLSTSDIVLEFTNPVTQAFMSDSGVFATKLGESLVATEFFVSFDMAMPNRLGQHLFDAFVLHTTQKTDPYYVDVLVGEARGTSLVTVERGIDSVGNVVDGTRFLRLNQLSAAGVTATSAISSATAALVAVSKSSFLPKDAKRALRLDVIVTANAGQTYDHLELQLPEGFKAVTNIVVVEGLTTLAQYTDYNLETDHSRSVGIKLQAKRTASSSFTVTFDLITPASLPQTETTYVFGLVVTDEESGLLTKTPVYAQAGKASSLNTSSTLSVLVKDGSVISGTIVLAELPLGLIAGNVVLSGNGTGTVYEKTLSFGKGVGSSTFDFGLTTADDLTAGVEPGSYQLTFSVLGFENFSTFVTIVDSQTSVEGLFIQMTPDPVQAALVLYPRYLEANGRTTSLSIYLDLNVTSGTNLTAFEFSVNPAAGATGSFSSSFVIDSVTAGNSVLNVPVSTTNLYTVDLSGVTATTNVVITASATVPTGTNGDFAVTGTVVSSAGSFTANSELDLTMPATLTVGSFVAIKTTEIAGAVIGDQYSAGLLSDYSVEKVNPATLAFSAQIFDKDVDVSSTIGLAMTTGGVLSGTPLLLSGSPYIVRVTLTADALVTTDGSYTTTVDLSLIVTRDAFAFYSAAPTVIPTTGGEFVVKGRGFTSVATVMVDAQAATVTVVDNETLRVVTGALASGNYALSVEDSGVTTSPLSNQELLVAAASPSTQAFDHVIEGEADLADYEIVGLGSFYQGDIKSALEAAFGVYDTTKWRAYYYDPAIGHQQVNSLSDDSSFTQIRPGTAFWRISRKVGTVATTGVAAELASEYYVNIPPASWMLISNVYDSAVSWENVSLMTSANGQTINTTARASDASNIVNPNLYGFDKEKAAMAEYAASPYSAVTVMEPGKGYWVQNKWVKDMTLKISRPTTQLGKANSTPVALRFKAGEDLPPQPPETFQKATAPGASVSSSSAGGGGGGGCLLK
jgi:hypothetical protein